MSLFYFVSTLATASSTKQQTTNPEMAKEYITEILQQPEFQTSRQIYYLRYINPNEKSPTEKATAKDSHTVIADFIESVAQLLELILWIAIGVILMLFIRYAPRWRRQPHVPSVTDTYQAASHVFKTTQTTPPHARVPEQALILWHSGEKRLALSLLYRSALFVLSARDGLTIEDSATESECMRLVRRSLPHERATYFSQLTRAWQQIAYAQRVSNDMDIQQLCNAWQRYFGETV